MSFEDAYFTATTTGIILLWIYGPAFFLGFSMPPVFRLINEKEGRTFYLNFVPWVFAGGLWAGFWGPLIFIHVEEFQKGLMVATGLLHFIIALVVMLFALVLRITLAVRKLAKVPH